MDTRDILSSAGRLILDVGYEMNLSDEIAADIERHDIHTVYRQQRLSEEDEQTAQYYSMLLQIFVRQRNAPLHLIEKSIKKSVQRLQQLRLEPLLSEMDTVTDVLDLLPVLRSACKQVDRPTKKRKLLYEIDYSKESWKIVYSYIVCWLGFDQLGTLYFQWTAADLLNCKGRDRLVSFVTKSNNIETGYLLFLLDCFAEHPLQFLQADNDLPPLRDIFKDVAYKYVIQYLAKVTHYSEYTLVCFLLKKLLDSEAFMNTTQVHRGDLEIGKVIREHLLRTPVSYAAYLDDDLTGPSVSDDKYSVHSNVYPLLVELDLILFEGNFRGAIRLAAKARFSPYLSEDDKDYIYYLVFEGLLKDGELLYDCNRPVQQRLSELYLRSGGEICRCRFMIQLLELKKYVSQAPILSSDVRDYVVFATRQTVLSMLMESFATMEGIPRQYQQYLESVVEVPHVKDKDKWAHEFLKIEVVYPASWGNQFSHEKMNEIVLRLNKQEPVYEDLLQLGTENADQQRQVSEPIAAEPVMEVSDTKMSEPSAPEPEAATTVPLLQRQPNTPEEPEAEILNDSSDEAIELDNNDDEMEDNERAQEEYSASDDEPMYDAMEPFVEQQEPIEVDDRSDEQQTGSGEDSERIDSDASHDHQVRSSDSDDDGYDSGGGDMPQNVVDESVHLESGYYGEESQVTEGSQGTEEDEDEHHRVSATTQLESPIAPETFQEPPIPAQPPAIEQHVDEGYMPEAEVHTDKPLSEAVSVQARVRFEDPGYDGEGSQCTDGEEEEHEIDSKAPPEDAPENETPSIEIPEKPSAMAEDHDKGYEPEDSHGQVDVDLPQDSSQKAPAEIASGYDAEVSQAEDDAEISEVNTEDEEDKNRTGEPKLGDEEHLSTSNVSKGRDHHQTLSDMDAADEMTNSELEEQIHNTPVARQAVDPPAHSAGGVLHSAAVAAYIETQGRHPVSQTSNGTASASPLDALAALASAEALAQCEETEQQITHDADETSKLAVPSQDETLGEAMAASPEVSGAGDAAEQVADVIEDSVEQPTVEDNQEHHKASDDEGAEEPMSIPEDNEAAPQIENENAEEHDTYQSEDEKEDAKDETLSEGKEADLGQEDDGDSEPEDDGPEDDVNQAMIPPISPVLLRRRETEAGTGADYASPSRSVQGSEYSLPARDIQVGVYSPGGSSLGMHSLDDDMSAVRENDEAFEGEPEEGVEEPGKTPKRANTQRSDKDSDTPKRALDLDSEDNDSKQDDSAAGGNRKRKADATKSDTPAAGSRRSNRSFGNASTPSRKSARSHKSSAAKKSPLEPIQEEAHGKPKEEPESESEEVAQFLPPVAKRGRRTPKSNPDDEDEVSPSPSKRGPGSSKKEPKADDASSVRSGPSTRSVASRTRSHASTPARSTRSARKADDASSVLTGPSTRSVASGTRSHDGSTRSSVRSGKSGRSKRSNRSAARTPKSPASTRSVGTRRSTRSQTSTTSTMVSSVASNATVYGLTMSGDPCKVCQKMKTYCKKHKDQDPNN